MWPTTTELVVCFALVGIGGLTVLGGGIYLVSLLCHHLAWLP